MSDYDDYRSPSAEAVTVQLNKEMIDEVIEAASKNVSAQVRKEASDAIKKHVEAEWNDVLRAEMRTMAERIVREWIIQPRDLTNSYGEKTGKTTTFSEEILKLWRDYLDKPVNANGNEESYSRDGATTRIRWMIKKYATETVESEIKKMLADVSVEARERVKEAVSAFIAQQLAPRVELKAIPQAKN